MQPKIENNMAIAQKNRLLSPARELPSDVERVMKSEAYWNAKHPDHRVVKEAVNRFFQTHTPPPEKVSVVTATINGKVHKQAVYREQKDARFTVNNGTTPDEISALVKGDI